MLRVMADTTELEALIARLVADRTLQRAGEAGTRMGAVNPTLRRLGWDTDNLDEVDPEFADGGGGKVDYCLRHRGRNLVLIEAKKASADLASHQGQLLHYAFGLGVELAALTNGLDWWLYLPMKAGRSFERRRFARIDFRELSAGAAADALNRFLSRDACISRAALREAEAEFEQQEQDAKVRAALPEAWNRVLRDAQFHELLAREAERITGVQPNRSTISEYLGKASAGRIPSPASEVPQAQMPAGQAAPQQPAPTPLTSGSPAALPSPADLAGC